MPVKGSLTFQSIPEGIMIRLTRAQVLALSPCSTSKIPNYGLRKTMTAKQALDAGATISDLLWVAGKLGRKDLCVKFALACAQRVSHHNTDPRVQAALSASQRVIDNDTIETRSAARSAAWSAEWAARSAARSAESAARSAAWSAESAARSAAWSAESAARSAARSAESAARSAEEAAQRRIFIEIFSVD